MRLFHKQQHDERELCSMCSGCQVLSRGEAGRRFSWTSAIPLSMKQSKASNDFMGKYGLHFIPNFLNKGLHYFQRELYIIKISTAFQYFLIKSDVF